MDKVIVRERIDNSSEHFKFKISDGAAIMDDCLYLGEYGKFSLVFVKGSGIVVCDGLDEYGLLEEIEGIYRKGIFGKMSDEDKEIYKLAKEAFNSCDREGSFYQF